MMADFCASIRPPCPAVAALCAGCGAGRARVRCSPVYGAHSGSYASSIGRERGASAEFGAVVDASAASVGLMLYRSRPRRLTSREHGQEHGSVRVGRHLVQTPGADLREGRHARGEAYTARLCHSETRARWGSKLSLSRCVRFVEGGSVVVRCGPPRVPTEWRCRPVVQTRVKGDGLAVRPAPARPAVLL